MNKIIKQFENENDVIHKILTSSYQLWLSVSIIFCFSNGLLFLLTGDTVLRAIIQKGPLSVIELTLTSVGIVWLAFGALLALLRNYTLRKKYGLTITLTFAVIVLYVNILRERIYYGDFVDYIQAAHNLAEGMDFHNRYLYPPFFATLLTPLLPFGDSFIFWALWVANIFSLPLFFILLVFALRQYGYEYRTSHWLAFFFVLLNVPILRTLGYVQVNLHVTNLILVSLIVYKKQPVMSAFALALASQVKISPIVLVLPFLLKRDWRWVTSWIIASITLVSITALPYGWEPFVSFLRNIQNVYSANAIVFRETSVDSFFRSIALLLSIPANKVTWLTYITKIFILLVTLRLMVHVIKNSTFIKNNTENVVYNSFPLLLILMLLMSPLIWEHHPVFVALPYLLVLKYLNSPFQVVLYGYAFLLEYLLPTFDFFPWSFGRLISPLLLLGIIYAISKEYNQPFWKW